jgi:hypothetical protein
MNFIYRRIKWTFVLLKFICRNLNEIIVSLFLTKPMKDQQIAADNNFIHVKTF